MRFELPLPPSVNAAYRNVPGVGRVKTDAFKAWEREASLLVMAARQKPLESGEYGLSMRFTFPNRRGDLNNYIKAPIDLLVRAGLTPDDRWNDHLEASRIVDKGAKPGVEIIAWSGAGPLGGVTVEIGGGA